jgi:hypothetical protein
MRCLSDSEFSNLLPQFGVAVILIIPLLVVTRSSLRVELINLTSEP